MNLVLPHVSRSSTASLQIPLLFLIAPPFLDPAKIYEIKITHKKTHNNQTHLYDQKISISSSRSHLLLPPKHPIFRFTCQSPGYTFCILIKNRQAKANKHVVDTKIRELEFTESADRRDSHSRMRLVKQTRKHFIYDLKTNR